MNIAETVKKQTDRILRQKALNGTDRIEVSGIATGTGAPAPTVNSPAADLTAHKTSGDHDGRYYTEAEVDALLTFLGLNDTPSTYVGEGGKLVAVKDDETGTEFVAAPPAENGVPTGGTTNQLAAKNSNDDYDIKWVDAPEAANGLPAGGTAGQVLAKIDGDDYNTEWVGGHANWPDNPPNSPSAWDDEFDGDTLKDKWSWLNQETSSVVIAHDRLMLYPKAANGARGLIQVVPEGDFDMRCKCTFFARPINYTQAGLLLYNSNNGRIVQFGHDRRTTSTTFGLRYQQYTSPTQWGSDPWTLIGIGLAALYLRVTVVNGTINTYYSPDGDEWIPAYSQSMATWLGALSHIGIFVNDNSTVVTPAKFDWFRVVES